MADHNGAAGLGVSHDSFEGISLPDSSTQRSSDGDVEMVDSSYQELLLDTPEEPETPAPVPEVEPEQNPAPVTRERKRSGARLENVPIDIGSVAETISAPSQLRKVKDSIFCFLESARDDCHQGGQADVVNLLFEVHSTWQLLSMLTNVENEALRDEYLAIALEDNLEKIQKMNEILADSIRIEVGRFKLSITKILELGASEGYIRRNINLSENYEYQVEQKIIENNFKLSILEKLIDEIITCIQEDGKNEYNPSTLRLQLQARLEQECKLHRRKLRHIFNDYYDQRADEPNPWNEGWALFEAFRNDRSFRGFVGILRWLRWVEVQYGNIPIERNFELKLPEGAKFVNERTKISKAQLLMPDASINHSHLFDRKELDVNGTFLLMIWKHLRQGGMGAAIKLCEDNKLGWRAAYIKGMFAYNPQGKPEIYDSNASFSDVGINLLDDGDAPDGGDAPVSSKSIDDDLNPASIQKNGPLAVERKQPAVPPSCDSSIIQKKREDFAQDDYDDKIYYHSDWAEKYFCTDGNPWRRVAKKNHLRECKQAAQGLEVLEIVLAGYACGHLPSLQPTLMSELDHCWAELHCIKEQLTERLIDDSRKRYQSLDDEEPDLELSGVYGPADESELIEISYTEITRIFSKTVEMQKGSDEEILIRKVQAALVYSIWEPAQGNAALDHLREYLERTSEQSMTTKQQDVIRRFASNLASIQFDMYYAPPDKRAKRRKLDVTERHRKISSLDGSNQSAVASNAPVDTYSITSNGSILNQQNIDYLTAKHIEIILEKLVEDQLDQTIKFIPDLLKRVSNRVKIDSIVKYYRKLLMKNLNETIHLELCIKEILHCFSNLTIHIFKEYVMQIIEMTWKNDQMSRTEKGDEILHCIRVLNINYLYILDIKDSGILQGMIVDFMDYEESTYMNLTQRLRVILEDCFIPSQIDLAICSCVNGEETTLRIKKLINESERETILITEEYSKFFVDVTLFNAYLDHDFPDLLTFTAQFAEWKRKSKYKEGEGTIMALNNMPYEDEEEAREVFLEKTLKFVSGPSFMERYEESSISESRWNEAKKYLAEQVLGALAIVVKEVSFLERIVDRVVEAISNSSWILDIVGADAAEKFLKITNDIVMNGPPLNKDLKERPQDLIDHFPPEPPINEIIGDMVE